MNTDPQHSGMDETLEIQRLPPLPERYETLGELGRGGMGIVYKARDRETGEVLAVKILKPEIAADTQILERFKNELRLAHRITHRNVARLYEFHRSGDTVFVSMEFVEGESLRALLRRSGKLDPEAGLAIARQIIAGIGEAHRQSIVHRDLKPENIMLTPSGEVKVMDFGISRSYAAGVTATGAIIGTPAYMAPEQAEARPTDQRTDVYACGLILYEMFTGTAAFSGETPVSVALKQIRERVTDPGKLAPGLPKHIEAAILKCLEKDPPKRFQSVENLARALEGAPVSAGAPRRVRIPRWTWAGALAIVAIAAVLWIWRSRPSDSLLLPVEQFTLPNGLPVVLSVDHGAPVFTLTVGYRAGVQRDPQDRKGLALLAAHLMQQGSANVAPGEHESLLEETGGDQTYGVDMDLAYVSDKMPSNQLEMVLFLEADRMRALDITPQGFESARSYVMEQIANQQNSPYTNALERMVQLSFSNPVNKRYTDGSVDDLKKATIEEATRFHQKYYVPSNAALTLVGDFDPKTARDRIRHYFGDIPAQTQPPAADTHETPFTAERRDQMVDPAAHVPVVIVAYPACSITLAEDWFLLKDLRELLAGSAAARMQSRLVNGAGVATAIESQLTDQAGANTLWFAIFAVPGKDLGQVEKLAIEEIDRVARQGVPPGEVDWLRNETLRARAMEFVPSRARSIAITKLILAGNRAEAVNDWEEYARKLSSEKFERAAAKYLTAANRTVVVVTPGVHHEGAH